MEDFVRVELNRHKDGFKCIKHTWINSIDASRCKTQTQRRGGAAMRAYKIGGGSRFVICRSALNLRFATPKTKQKKRIFHRPQGTRLSRRSTCVNWNASARGIANSDR